MKTYAVLFGILICILTIDARHYSEHNEPDPLSSDDEQADAPKRVREHGGPMRHRKRRWQMNYGYDYQAPPIPWYPENRRDYERNQDILPQILRLLDEISAYVKRPAPPPPPPQPIYIPYPVPYPVPQYCNCNSNVNPLSPNLTSRFPDLEDTNQNWGFIQETSHNSEDDGDGSRPISFVPIKPQRPIKIPAPEVEHGSSQAGEPTTEAPRFKEQPTRTVRTPAMCNVAVLSCCSGNLQQRRTCFTGFGCGMSFANGDACSQDNINAVIESFRTAYSPVN